MCDQGRYSRQGPVDSVPSCVGHAALADVFSVLVEKVDQYDLSHTVNKAPMQSKSTEAVSAHTCLAGIASTTALLRRISRDRRFYLKRPNFVRMILVACDRVRVAGRNTIWTARLPSQLQLYSLGPAPSSLSRLVSVSESFTALSIFRDICQYSKFAGRRCAWG